MNPILGTDSYKGSHQDQTPPNLEFVESYFTSRGGQYPEVLWFGALNYHLPLALQDITRHDIEEADDFFGDHFGTKAVFATQKSGWEHILNVHGGRMPLEVRALPEGALVPNQHALMVVKNTDKFVPWLTNNRETLLSHVWYPMTVATLSRGCRQLIHRYLELTGDPSLVDFKLHDFGYRGSTSNESAGVGGLAHLVNFKGTDTLAALVMARKWYDCKMAGFSIPAAEHMTITAWGKAREVDAYRNMLEKYPTNLVAVVSDSYDIYAACEHLWGEVLHDEVMRRAGVLVIRPDSGYPPAVVHKLLDILGAKFGSETNEKGYRVLDPHVRIIQGDGVDPQMIDAVYGNMLINGWSADNVGFGMGGALLQKVNRDTCQCAFKCDHVVIDGVGQPVFKSPVGDAAKASRPGPLTTYYLGNGSWRTDRPGLMLPDAMRTVWKNGELLVNDSLDTIRARVNDDSLWLPEKAERVAKAMA